MNLRREQVYIVLILSLALSLRMGAVLYLGDFRPPWTEDWESIAQVLVTKSYFGLDFISLYGSNPKGVTAFIPPVYPGFLAMTVILFGSSSWFAVRIIQALSSVGAVGLIYLLGRTAFQRPDVSKLAALGAAVFPPFIGAVVEINPGAFEVFFYELAVLLTLFALRRSLWWRWAILGVALGIAALLRPTILTLLPFLLFASWTGGVKSSLRAVLFPSFVILIAAFAVIIPWTIRNYAVLGEPILISSNGGVNFWIGNHSGATGEFIYPPEELLKQVEPLSEGERDHFFYQQAMAFIQADPQQFVYLLVSKLIYFVWERPSIGASYSNQTAVGLGRLAYLLGNGMLWPISILGMLLAVKKWRHLVPLYGAILSVLFTNVLYFAGTRYKTPSSPFLIVFASFGLVVSVRYLYDRLHTDRTPSPVAGRL